MAAIATFVKDPQAHLDYSVDWSPWLGSDTLTSSTWVATDGITMATDQHTTTLTTIWLTGGTEDRSYQLRNHITTTAGRGDYRTIVINIHSR